MAGVQVEELVSSQVHSELGDLQARGGERMLGVVVGKARGLVLTWKG